MTHLELGHQSSVVPHQYLDATWPVMLDRACQQYVQRVAEGGDQGRSLAWDYLCVQVCSKISSPFPLKDPRFRFLTFRSGFQRSFCPSYLDLSEGVKETKWERARCDLASPLVWASPPLRH